MSTGIVVLAAGSSSRMGRSKQLLPLEGKTLLAHVVEKSIASKAHPVVVVLGANAHAHLETIHQYHVTTVINNDWESGMGSTIKCGLQTLLNEHPTTASAIFLTVDQPYLTTDLIDLMIHVYEESKPDGVAASYGNTIGIPALFSHSLFPEILATEDTQGAKVLLQRHRTTIRHVDFPKGETDLDTPEDYDQFLKSSK